MKIKFWGTRGSIPAPGPDTVKYGGNTTCVEVRLKDNTLLIIDAGTGIRKLGLSLIKENITQINLFLTHSHWDHIQGFPFFAPAHFPSVEIDIFGRPPAYSKLKELLADQMEYRYFPVNFDDLKSKINFIEIYKNKFTINNATMHIIETNHPGATHALRIEEDGANFVFLTDNEIHPPTLPKNPYKDFVNFSFKADLFVHDAQYTPEEMSNKKGWGHSSYDQATQLAIDARVKSFALFHHEPEHTDKDIDAILMKCKRIIKKQKSSLKCFAAKEESKIEI